MDQVGGEAATPASPFQRDKEVVFHRQPAEGLLALECAADPMTGTPGGRATGDVVLVEADRARPGGSDTGEAVEQRCLACTIGPDQPTDLTWIEVDAHLSQGGDSAERHRHVVCLQDRVPEFARVRGPCPFRHLVTNPRRPRRLHREDISAPGARSMAPWSAEESRGFAELSLG